MIRKFHLIILALVAAAFAAPIAQGGTPKVDPLAVSWLRGHGYSASQIAAMTGVTSPANAPVKVDPLAISWLRGHGYSASQIAAMTGVTSPAGARVKVDPLAVSWLRGHGYSASQIAAMTGVTSAAGATAKVDPLAVSYLRSFGLSPGEVRDWTTGLCSRQVKPATCFAVFDRPPSTTPAGTSSGFGWADAGIGAASTLGVILLLAGLATTVGFRRRKHELEHA